MDSGSRCSAAGPESSRAESRRHQASNSGLMVLGEPVPSFSRILSMVGRWPDRSRASAARSTSPTEIPRRRSP